jgi:hypothetical protein
MTVLPPRTPVEDWRPEPPVAPRAIAATAPEPPVVSTRPRTSLERIVLGLLLAGAGAAWLLDAAGVSVPWALAPAVAVVTGR